MSYNFKENWVYLPEIKVLINLEKVTAINFSDDDSCWLTIDDKKTYVGQEIDKKILKKIFSPVISYYENKYSDEKSTK